MALPFTILRNGVEGIYDLKLSDEKKRAIKEMGYGTNLKVMYGFTERLWRKPAGGRDFFCNGSVYADKSFQTVWETSRGQSGDSGIITNFMGGTPGAQYGPDQIDKFIAELDTIFPGLKAKHDGNKTMLNLAQHENHARQLLQPAGRPIYLGLWCGCHARTGRPPHLRWRARQRRVPWLHERRR